MMTDRCEEMRRKPNYPLIFKKAPYSAVSFRGALCSAALQAEQQALEHCCYLQVCSVQCSKGTRNQVLRWDARAWERD